MALIKLALLSLLSIYTGLIRQFGAKTVWFVIAAIVLILFGDIVAAKLAYVSHLVLETIAYGMEQLLQANFDLTPRQAELIVAWIGMAVMTCVVLRLLYKAYIFSLVAIAHLRVIALATRENMKSNPKKAALLVSAVTFGTLGTTFLLFS